MADGPSPMKVLIIEDDPRGSQWARGLLESDGLAVDTLSSDRTADLIEPEGYAAVVFCATEYGGSAAPLLKSMRAQGLGMPFAVVSPEFSADEAIRAVNSGADLLVRVGDDRHAEELLEMARHACEKATVNYSHDDGGGLFSVLERLKEGVLTLDPSGLITFANRAARESLGFEDEGLQGKRLIDMVSESAQEQTIEGLRDRIRSNHWDFKEYRLRNADGEEVQVEASALLLRVDGQPVDLLVFRDVTEDRRAAAATDEEMGRLRSMFDSMEQPIYVVDIDDHEILYLNKAAKSLYGACLEGGRCYRELQGRDAPCEFCTNDIIRELNGQTYVWDHHNKVLDKHFHVINRLIPWPDGRMVRFEMAVDISEEKRAMADLAEERGRSSRILDSLPDTVLVVDQHSRVMDWRANLPSGTGLNPAEIVGRTAKDFLDRDAAKEIEGKVSEALEDGGIKESDLILTMDGGPLHLNARIAKLSEGEAIIVLRDVTAVKRAEEELIESERRYRELFDNAPAMVTVYDWETNDIRYANRKAVQMMGYDDLEDFIRTGVVWGEPPYSKADTLEVNRKLEHEGVSELLWLTRRKDGSSFWELMSLNVMPFGGKKSIVSISIDFSERMESYRALQEAEGRYRTLISASNSGAWEHDRETGVLWTSPEYWSMLGREPPSEEGEGGLGTMWTELLHPEDRDAATRTFRDYLEQGPESMYEQTFRMSHAEGGWVWIWSRGRTLRDEEGRPGSLTVGTHIDITAMKEMELALAESEHKFRTMADSGDAIVYTTDEHGRLDYLNRRWEQYTGTPSEEGLGRGWEDMVHPEDREGFLPRFYAAIEAREPLTAHYRLLNSEGGHRWVQEKAVPLHDLEGRYLGHLGQIMDIHELRMMVEALRTANKKLNLMTSITRHDILNQLMVMKGYISLLDEGAKEEGMSGVSDVLLRSCDQIQKQIEFTSEYQDLGVKRPRWQDLESIVATQVHRPARLEKRVSGLELYADPLLEKVFRNLIDNSKRHGGDVSRISIWHEPGDDGDLILYYQDDGVGVPASQKGRIFSKGYGNNNGMGLFLIKEILAITGIRISETGREGEGALFRIDVPRGRYRFR